MIVFNVRAQLVKTEAENECPKFREKVKGELYNRRIYHSILVPTKERNFNIK